MNAQSILSSGGFLALSREQSRKGSQSQYPFSFELENGVAVSVVGLGMIQFSPASISENEQKNIVLSSGIHGNETAPIEICSDMVDDILSQSLVPEHRVLFIFGNLPAMDIAERFVEENLNRLFSGAHSKGIGCVNDERLRAKEIEEAISAFFEAGSADRYHYDLHTAIRASKNEKFAVYPHTDGRARSEEQVRFLAACGVKTVLLFETAQNTLSYFSSSRFNAHAFTVELGKVRPFGENDMTRFEDAKNTLRTLVSKLVLDLSAIGLDDVLVYKIFKDVIKHQEDFALHFSDDTPNFTDYKKGTILATETGATVSTEYDGEAIVFPNADVAIGQRALLTVIPSSLEA